MHDQGDVGLKNGSYIFVYSFASLFVCLFGCLFEGFHLFAEKFKHLVLDKASETSVAPLRSQLGSSGTLL